MEPILIGAVLGLGGVALLGAWRSVRAWRTSRRRPRRLVLVLQVGLQAVVGVAALLLGLWLLLAPEVG